MTHLLDQLSRVSPSRLPSVLVASTREINLALGSVADRSETGAPVRAPRGVANGSTIPGPTVVEGKLEGIILFLDGVEDEAARYVPEPLRVFPGGGHAALLLSINSFTNVVVDGRPVPDFTMSVLFVVTYPGPGEAPTPVETYAVWFLTSDRGIGAQLAEVGLGCRARSTFFCDVPDLTMDSRGDGSALATITGEVPWPFSPHSMSATFHSRRVEGNWAPSNRHWYAGARGLVVEHVAYADQASAFGTGTVRADPGTPLFRILGEQKSAAAAAVAFSASFKAVFTVVG
jgi:hypothetical protein